MDATKNPAKNDWPDVMAQKMFLNGAIPPSYDIHVDYGMDMTINEFVCPYCKTMVREYAHKGNRMMCNHATMAFYGSYPTAPVEMLLVRRYPGGYGSYTTYEDMKRAEYERYLTSMYPYSGFQQRLEKESKACAHKWIGRLEGIDHTSPNQREFFEECDICHERKK
jgi:hypothetical protein